MNTRHVHDQASMFSDPQILSGKPMIKGIPVGLVLERLAHDLNTKTLFADYPRLTKEDVQAMLQYIHAFFDNPLLYIAAKQTLETPGAKTIDEKPDIEEILSLAGTWGERDWKQIEQDLDHIRHASPPTPPITLDL